LQKTLGLSAKSDYVPARISVQGDWSRGSAVKGQIKTEKNRVLVESPDRMGSKRRVRSSAKAEAAALLTTAERTKA
jgi:hypothetical protein